MSRRVAAVVGVLGLACLEAVAWPAYLIALASAPVDTEPVAHLLSLMSVLCVVVTIMCLMGPRRGPANGVAPEGMLTDGKCLPWHSFDAVVVVRGQRSRPSVAKAVWPAGATVLCLPWVWPDRTLPTVLAHGVPDVPPMPPDDAGIDWPQERKEDEAPSSGLGRLTAWAWIALVPYFAAYAVVWLQLRGSLPSWPPFGVAAHATTGTLAVLAGVCGITRRKPPAEAEGHSPS